MKEVILWLIGLIVFVAVMTLLVLYSMRFDRYAQPYREETRRRTWENSISREQGVNTNIASYCLNMRTATDLPSKKAFAQFVLSQAETYSGTLTEDSQVCLNDAKSIMNAPAAAQ